MVIKEPGEAHAVDKIIRKSQLLMKIMTSDYDTALSGSWVDWFKRENFWFKKENFKKGKISKLHYI